MSSTFAVTSPLKITDKYGLNCNEDRTFFEKRTRIAPMMTPLTSISSVCFGIVFFMDLSVIYLIVKERLWRDDNAVLICNLMVAFLFHCFWQIFTLVCDGLHCDLKALHFVLALQTVAHVAILLTLVFLSYDRFISLKRKTLVKLHSRQFALRRIVCVWAVAILVASLTVIGAAILTDHRGRFFTLFLIGHCVSFVGVMIVISILFTRVWRMHRDNYKRSAEKGMSADPMWQRTHKASGRLSLTVASLAIGQCVTWIPVYAFMIVSNKSLFRTDYQSPVFITFLFLNFFSAPLLVFVFSEQFRQYFKRRFLWCFYLEPQELSWIDDTLRSSVRYPVSAEDERPSGTNNTDET